MTKNKLFDEPTPFLFTFSSNFSEFRLRRHVLPRSAARRHGSATRRRDAPSTTICTTSKVFPCFSWLSRPRTIGISMSSLVSINTELYCIGRKDPMPQVMSCLLKFQKSRRNDLARTREQKEPRKYPAANSSTRFHSLRVVIDSLQFLPKRMSLTPQESLHCIAMPHPPRPSPSHTHHTTTATHHINIHLPPPKTAAETKPPYLRSITSTLSPNSKLPSPSSSILPATLSPPISHSHGKGHL